MAEKVGKATKEKTKAGRTVYITDKDIKNEKVNQNSTAKKRT